VDLVEDCKKATFVHILSRKKVKENSMASGVVQDSGIGPIMFLIYINELIASLENTTFKLNCLRMMLSYTSESLINLTLLYSNQHSTL